jgi:hypothetical protein
MLHHPVIRGELPPGSVGFLVIGCFVRIRTAIKGLPCHNLGLRDTVARLSSISSAHVLLVTSAAD